MQEFKVYVTEYNMKERLISLALNKAVVSFPVCGMRYVEVELVLPKGTKIPANVDYREDRYEITIKVPGIFIHNIFTGEISDRSKIDEFISSLGLDKIQNEETEISASTTANN